MLKLWRKWNRKYRIRFHNRLMVYNTLIFLVVAYVLTFFATHYASQFDKLKQLQQSRDALNALYNYYDSKHDQFLNLVFPLYEVTENYSTLSRLLESVSDDEYENDPFVKQNIVQMLQGIAIRDADISAVLVYKNLTGVHYIYDAKSRTFSTISGDFPFIHQLKQQKLGRYNYGTQVFKTGSLSNLQVYGISGSLGTLNIRQNAGRFIVAYNTSGIERIFQSYARRSKGRFVIVSNSGQLIFDSTGDYGNGTFPYMDLLNEDKTSATLDGEHYYIQTIKSLNRNYFVANLVPKQLIDQSNSNLPLLAYAGVTATALICALLYSVTGSFVSRRFRELVKAMKFVGSNNLSYRVPIHRNKDEISDLAASFNRMCDELQDTIHREYLSELKKKNAELNALQAGINPHFLYNTLEAIRVMSLDAGNSVVAEMIVLLANLYRSIVRDHTFIPIRKELNLCEMYMNIFSLRYDSHLHYEINVDPVIMEYGIPKNLLQPIIENYFVHGIRSNDQDNQFRIHGFMENGDIHFHFEDNGRGMNNNRLAEVISRLNRTDLRPNSDYGLANIQERIQIVFGKSYGLSPESEENQHTKVTVRIKAMTCEELENSINKL